VLSWLKFWDRNSESADPITAEYDAKYKERFKRGGLAEVERILALDTYSEDSIEGKPRARKWREDYKTWQKWIAFFKWAIPVLIGAVGLFIMWDTWVNPPPTPPT
jgi:hypothetical protein